MDKNISFTLKVWRQKGPKAKGAFETYQMKDIPGDTSFLEMLDILNEQLISEGKEPVVFDHDCREGICGMCSLYINGHPHGPATGATTCQIYMRRFKGFPYKVSRGENGYIGTLAHADGLQCLTSLPKTRNLQ